MKWIEHDKSQDILSRAFEEIWDSEKAHNFQKVPIKFTESNMNMKEMPIKILLIITKIEKYIYIYTLVSPVFPFHAVTT